MFHKVQPQAFVLLTVTAVIALAPMALCFGGVLSPTASFFYVQPVTACVGALVTFMMLGGKKDRIRRRFDKALTVGSVLVIWFVLYFLSGLSTTYTHNAVVASISGVLLNIVVYSIPVIGFEYARHGVMLLAGRRQVLFFGILVSLIFALQQMNFMALTNTHAAGDVIKLVISDFIPVLTMSCLLTFLSVTAGLPSQIVYRLGLTFAAILPPIIPKYDWYMTGVSLILLAVAIYITMDRTRERAEETRSHRSRKYHPRIAFDIMFTLVMIAMALFMTGAFSYKPKAIMSNSMVPVFERGSLVIVQNASSMDVQVGDIVQYEAQGKSITHRVMKITENAEGSGKRVFITKGDNNRSDDLPVKEHQVTGIVRAQIPYIGYGSVWISELMHRK